MDAARCPAREELESLLDERLAPADLRRVSAHVAGCPACQAALEGLTADPDSAVSSWRGGKAADSSPPNPEFLDRIKYAPPAAPQSPSIAQAERPADGDDGELHPEPIDYQILEVLGRGGEGVVYLARHRPLGRLVALKMMRGADQAQPQALARFRLEAETLARLHHPNIVQVYEVGEHAGRPFFAMEYVAGGPLSARLGGQPQPARDAAAMVEASARAVHAAHKAGVIHRDLKPANVLLAADGAPKISDFGLAKRVKVDASLSRTGAVLGTPAYMAPEQARGEGEAVSPACDVYALGSILYHLLTGRPPFVGPRPMDVLLQVVHDEPVSVRRLFPRAPRDLENICLKCLNKDPRRRYPSAEALADDLRRHLDGRLVLARPAAPWERAWKAARRRPVIATLVAACAAALLLVLGGGAYYNGRLAVEAKKSDDKAADARAAEKKASEEAAAARAAEKKAGDEAAAAQASAAEAERQRGLAEGAYEKLVYEVQDKLGRTAATRPLRESLLRAAADGLKEIAKGAGSGAADQVQAAAHMKIGQILYDISDYAGARAEFEACRDIALALRKADPHDPHPRDLLCQAYSGMGNVAARDGRSWDASAAFKQEMDCAQGWYDDEPNNLAARERLAESYNWLGGEFPNPLWPASFKDYNDRLLALVEPWAKADPGSRAARYYLAAARQRGGRLCLLNGDPAGARDSFLRTKELVDALVVERPDDPKYTQGVMAADQALCAVYVELGEPGKALPYATAEAESFRQALKSGKNDPENAEFQWMCGDAFVTRAAVLMRLMRHEEAAKELAAAVELFHALQPRLKPGLTADKVRERLAQAEEELEFCRAVPDALRDPNMALRQPSTACQDLLIIRVCLLTQQGRVEEANKAADLVDALKPASVEDCCSLAHFLSGDLAGLTAGKEPEAFTDAERAMRRRLVDQALAALNRAADLGFHDVDQLRADGDLWVLRQEPGFRAFVERMKKTP